MDHRLRGLRARRARQHRPRPAGPPRRAPYRSARSRLSRSPRSPARRRAHTTWTARSKGAASSLQSSAGARKSKDFSSCARTSDDTVTRHMGHEECMRRRTSLRVEVLLHHHPRPSHAKGASPRPASPPRVLAPRRLLLAPNSIGGCSSQVEEPHVALGRVQ